MILLKDGKLVAKKVGLHQKRFKFRQNHLSKTVMKMVNYYHNHEHHSLDWRAPPLPQEELLLRGMAPQVKVLMINFHLCFTPQADLVPLVSKGEAGGGRGGGDGLAVNRQ